MRTTDYASSLLVSQLSTSPLSQHHNAHRLSRTVIPQTTALDSSLLPSCALSYLPCLTCLICPLAFSSVNCRQGTQKRKKKGLSSG